MSKGKFTYPCQPFSKTKIGIFIPIMRELNVWDIIGKLGTYLVRPGQ